MKLIDTHCHLTDERFSGTLEDMLARAEDAGVVAMVGVATGVGDSAAAAELAGQYEQVYCTAGVHPHEADGVSEDYLRRLEKLAGDSKNVAIGEVGLDYHYDFSPRDVQRRVFAEQLELAVRLCKPAVIHTREAFDETMSILIESGVEGRRVVFHSFTEGASRMREALDFGAVIGLSGIVTFKNAGQLRDAARLVPDDRLLIETDAPYLSPEPVRKMQVNEPANVAHVAKCLAAVRRTALETFTEQTTANAVRFFALDTEA